MIQYEEKILKRWKTPSMLQTLRLPGVRRMLLCTICLFFKYRILNKFIVIMITKIPANQKYIGFFLFSSEIVQIFFGFLVLKWLKGRRNVFLALLMLLALALELLQIIVYSISDRDPSFESPGFLFLVTLQGIIVYSLYYMLCVCGPVDLAKVELLKTNFKLAGMLFGVLCGFQCLVQALFLDEIIDRFLNYSFFQQTTDFYTITGINFGCTIIAFLSIFSVVKKELKELKSFSWGAKAQMKADKKSLKIQSDVRQSMLLSREFAKKITVLTSGDNDNDTLLSEDRDLSSSVQVNSISPIGIALQK
ncbi:hypothetical protein FGO68_gene8284 [Halteria grandinella]|uniref:Uncharacterized protein n=1 Tax=Halteria grandinella TaxID=5974 RepID=A0A8J8NUZ2_HALGN|nr:hypothetical protein FGO68_gene8284 [Halteria grandinella]